MNFCLTMIIMHQSNFSNSFDKSIDTVRKNKGFSKLREVYNTRWTSKNPLFANEFYQFLINKLGQDLWEKQGGLQTRRYKISH